jgi:hypothetical protein
MGPANFRWDRQSADAVRAEWDGGDIAKRRGMLTQALGDLRLALDPAKGGRRGFDTTRLRPIASETSVAIG